MPVLGTPMMMALMENAAMRAAGKPVSAGEVAKSLNADRKEVDGG